MAYYCFKHNGCIAINIYLYIYASNTVKSSSSAVAGRLCDALCPSVVSFDSVIPRAQSFITVTSLCTILVCCLLAQAPKS